MFLSAGKPPSGDVLLGDLNLKPKTKIMMMGTREEVLVCFKLLQLNGKVPSQVSTMLCCLEEHINLFLPLTCLMSSTLDVVLVNIW